MSHRRGLEEVLRRLALHPGDPGTWAEVLAAGLRVDRTEPALDALDRALAAAGGGAAREAAWLGAVRASGYGWGDPRLQHRGRLGLVAVSPAGRWLVAFSGADGLVLRDARTGAVAARAPVAAWGPGAGKHLLHAAPGDGRLAVGAVECAGGTSRVWLALWSEAEPERIRLHRVEMAAAPEAGFRSPAVLAADRDLARFLVAIDHRRIVHLGLDPAAPARPPVVSELDPDPANPCAWARLSPDGDLVATVGPVQAGDRRVSLAIRRPGGETIAEYGPMEDGPRELAFSGDSGLLAGLWQEAPLEWSSSSGEFMHWTDYEHVLVLYDLLQPRACWGRRLRATPRERLDRPRCEPLGFDAERRPQALNRVLALGDGEPTRLRVPRKGPGAPVKGASLATAPGGETAWILGPDGARVRAPLVHPVPLVEVKAVAGGTRLASSDREGGLALFDTATGAPVGHWPPARPGEDRAVVDPGATRVVRRTREGIVVEDPAGRGPSRRLPWPGRWPESWVSAALDPTGAHLVSADADGRIRVRELGKGRLVWPPYETSPDADLCSDPDRALVPVRVGWLPDGAFFSLWQAEARPSQLRIRRLEEPEPRLDLVLDPGEARLAEPLPGSGRIGLVGARGLFLAGDSEVLWAEAAGAGALAFAADGTRAACVAGDGHTVMVAELDEDSRAVPGSTRAIPLPYRAPALAWLPGGDTLAVAQLCHLRRVPV